MEATDAQQSTPALEGLRELQQARDGEQQAGRFLLQTFGPSMVRTAWRVLGRYGAAEADDVVQEAFIAALTTPSLPRGDVGVWLRAITARRALDWLRQRKRRGEQAPAEFGSEAHEPASSAAASDAVLTLRAVLARLPAVDRAILTLVDIEGFSMRETAEQLGLTRVAVKLRASRARRRLRRELDSSWAETAATAAGEEGP